MLLLRDFRARIRSNPSQPVGVSMRNPFQLPPEQAHFAPELGRAIVDELYKRAWAAFAALLLVLVVMRSVLSARRAVLVAVESGSAVIGRP